MIEKFERRIGVVDIFLMALAIVSLLLLLYEEVTHPSPGVRDRIVLVDLGIVSLFALEFVVRVAQAERRGSYVARHWYDIIGMIPISHPLFRGFRLLRLVRLFVIGSRFLRATDRTFGEAFVHGQITKYRKALAEELTDPILIALLAQLRRAVGEARIGTALAKGIAAKKDRLVQQVLKPIREDMPLLLKVPGVGPAVERIPARTLDNVVAMLGSKETDDAISGALQTALANLEADLKKRTWAEIPPRVEPTI